MILYQRICFCKPNKGFDGGNHNWCLIDKHEQQSSFRPVNSQVNEPLLCNYTGNFYIFIPFFYSLYSAKSPLMNNRAKPCLEGMDKIQFEQEKHTKNELFGPTNTLYKIMTTEAELVEEIKWMDAKNKASQDTAIKEMHESNVTRLLAFEKYKQDMISE